MKTVMLSALAILSLSLLTGFSSKRHTTNFDCETEAGELVGCMMLPSDSPEQGPPAAASKQSRTNQISLLDRSELTGASAPLLPAVFPNESGRGAVNTAMLSALQTEEQVRRVELFLKSTAASRGDLRVVVSQAPPK